MDIRVGITTSNLESRDHKLIDLRSISGFAVEVVSGPKQALSQLPGQVSLASKEGWLIVNGSQINARSIRLKTLDGNAIAVTTLSRGQHCPSYAGQIELIAHNDKLQMILITNMERYLQGVLGSEIPGSYQLEAIKAQAVAARTYALNPRISHKAEGFDVCDSYLCCQYFAGSLTASGKHHQAIIETEGQILIYKDKPILALFSSCAGGHTESYENCFSDPITGAFPPDSLAYLRGVPEGILPGPVSSEAGLRTLWQLANPNTYDSWSPHFRWSVNITDRDLEGHMHYVIEVLKKDPEFAQFIVAPPSGVFGHIERFEVTKYGIAGTAIELAVHTSKGTWIFIKELTIRSIFKNPDLNLSRLQSARVFFDYQRNSLGLLSKLVVHGLGWGHGVGLQQVGAQGMAMAGRHYTDILSHYYSGAVIEKLSG